MHGVSYFSLGSVAALRAWSADADEDSVRDDGTGRPDVHDRNGTLHRRRAVRTHGRSSGHHMQPVQQTGYEHELQTADDTGARPRETAVQRQVIGNGAL